MYDIQLFIERFFSKYSRKKIYFVSLLVGALLLVVLSWFLYHYIVLQREQKAQGALATRLEAQVAAADKIIWADQIAAWDVAYYEHKHSKLAAYFLVFKAEAQIKQGDESAACATMIEALKVMPRNSPLFYLYATKLALMKIDSTVPVIHDMGIHELDILAHDVHNPEWDWASYYYALLMAQQGEVTQALNEWSRLVSKASQASIWAHEARQQLAHRSPVAQKTLA